MAPSPQPSPNREANVGFVNALLETEIDQRNARKADQETTARWIVATSGLVLTLLLGLAKDAGVYDAAASTLVQGAFGFAVGLGALAAMSAIGTIFPRKYERLGSEGIDQLISAEALDLPTHEIMGRVVSTRRDIVKKMDELHKQKAGFLGVSLALLVASFVALFVLGVGLVGTRSDSTASLRSMDRYGLHHWRPNRRPLK